MIQSELSPDPETAAFARRLVEDALSDWGVPGLIETATLVVSELVTNAILHGKPPLSLVLSYYGNCLIGQVRDHGDTWMVDEPLLARNAGSAEHGRGLAIVEASVNRWGVAPLGAEGPGKAVWFTMIHSPTRRLPAD